MGFLKGERAPCARGLCVGGGADALQATRRFARTTWMMAVSVHMLATASAAACCSSVSALQLAADSSRSPPRAAISSLSRSLVESTARHCTATTCRAQHTCACQWTFTRLV
jgi:hypothetical protein